jgi:carboxypeptidase Q
MISPRKKPMNVLGLGYSVGTNGSVLTSDVIVVKTFEELQNRSKEVKGKFVVYNFDYTSYEDQVIYRIYGATFAATFGATAALVSI